MKCDVTDAEQVEAAVTQVEEQLGPVEVLVANAGITRDGLLVRMSEADFTDVLATNLTATWRLAKRVVPKMMKARWGRIIVVSSVGAYIGAPGPGQLRRVEGRPHRPGPLHRPRVRPPRHHRQRRGARPDRHRHARRACPRTSAPLLGAQVPVGRIGTVDEVAAAVTFLASEPAAFITGAVVPVDGGLGMGF